MPVQILVVVTTHKQYYLLRPNLTLEEKEFFPIFFPNPNPEPNPLKRRIQIDS